VSLSLAEPEPARPADPDPADPDPRPAAPEPEPLDPGGFLRRVGGEDAVERELAPAVRVRVEGLAGAGLAEVDLVLEVLDLVARDAAGVAAAVEVVSGAEVGAGDLVPGGHAEDAELALDFPLDQAAHDLAVLLGAAHEVLGDPADLGRLDLALLGEQRRDPLGLGPGHVAEARQRL
jgi:hypothetical protein